MTSWAAGNVLCDVAGAPGSVSRPGAGASSCAGGPDEGGGEGVVGGVVGDVGDGCGAGDVVAGDVDAAPLFGCGASTTGSAATGVSVGGAAVCELKGADCTSLKTIGASGG